MTKVVYNACFGGFSLSQQAILRGQEISGNPEWGAKYDGRTIARDDPVLVQVIEELGSKADGRSAALFIRDVPAGTKYRIDEYDGNERVMAVDDYDDWQIADVVSQ